jgi:predicted HD phosphohydrolase
METVGFTRMEDGSKEDYLLLERLEKEHTAGTADRILIHLRQLSNSFSGYKIDRLEHSLQAATRAYRDGADEEMVVAALLHDIGDLLAPHNHSEVAAAILKPYVSSRTHWVIKHHGLFQSFYYAHHLGGDRNARDSYRGYPYFQDAVDFCHRWDQPSFDPHYDSRDLAYFEPIVRRVFSRNPFTSVDRNEDRRTLKKYHFPSTE